MRITNDEYSPIQLLSELSTSETCKWGGRGDFFVDDKAKHDWLVEEWRDKIDEILNLFERYGTLVTGSQSVRDNGIDVYLSFTHNDKTHRVGFQIKSESEVLRDKGTNEKHSVIGALKRQAFEAIHSGKVDEWWVVPCINYNKHHKLIQQINAEIIVGMSNHNGVKIKLLDPRDAISFLSKDKGEIDALCTRFLCREDEVLKGALSEVEDLTTFQRKCILSFIFRGLEGRAYVSSEEILDFETGEEEDLAGEFLTLEDMDFLESDHGEGFIIKPFNLPGICALYFEGRVRHGLSHDGAESFVLTLLADPDEMD
ncbi:hypothetical protein D3C77_358870 [compost metagenome]